MLLGGNGIVSSNLAHPAIITPSLVDAHHQESSFCHAARLFTPYSDL
jgi:hypothetical protein